MHSLRIGKIRDITLRVHWSWILGVAVLAAMEHPLLIYLVALLPIVLLHELGHGIVAQHFGLKVIDITFWPLGGFARMSRIPEDSRVEGLVAVAGPAVNLALALIAVPFCFIPGFAGDIAWVFCLVNLLLGGTNLLPAFPLDGGRVLRAWLGRKGDWVRATERAVAVGRYVAIAMVVIGLFYGNLLLAVFGVLFWVSGAQERLGVRLRHGLPPFAMRGFGATFGGGASPFGGGANPFGGPAEEDEEREVEHEVRAPINGDSGRLGADETPAPRGSGFSSSDIERLERFHGPMRQLPDES